MHTTTSPQTPQVRDSDNDTVTIDGIAVPYGTEIDYMGTRETFATGAFDPDQAVGRPLLWAHDRAEPMGKVTAARNTADGLQVTAVIQPTARGRDAAVLLRSGSMGGLSVGFDPDQPDISGGLVTYTRARLMELSLTPLPAYQDAQVTATRQEEAMPETDVVPEAAEERSVDLAPITARIDQVEARMSAPPAAPARVIGVRQALALCITDLARTGQRRALADVISSGNAGVLPPDWDASVLNVLDTARPVIGASGAAGFPITGMTKTFPKITQHTTVTYRGTEKSEVPTRALTTGTDVYTADWYAGAVDVALELIEQSDPSIAALVAQDLMDQYAIASEVGHVDAAEVGGTAHGAVLDTSSYAALINDLIITSTAIQAATGFPGDQLAVVKADWAAILGLVDSDNRRVFATQGGVNADGSASLTANSINVGGINIFYSPRSTVSMQFNDRALLVGEKAPMGLQSVNVALAGRDLGVLGAILSVPRIPAGIVVYQV